MSKVEVDLAVDIFDRVCKYISEGRFKDLNDFFGQAAKLMLYSEDSKDEFFGVLKTGAGN